MDAKEGKILRLLEGSDKKFIIPVYQRSYDWKLDNCRLLLKDLITMNEEGYKSHFFGKTTLIQNANKYFGINQSLYRKAKEVSDGFYIETNLDSNTKIRVVKDAMNLLEIDPSEVLFVLDKSFDIRDDATYSKKKVGDLAYTLFYELLEKNKISDEEIENLMDKGYSHSLFYKLNYPVLSLSRDNYAKGSTKRYYKEPIICNGTKLYITSQWFEEDRDAIIKYYYSQVE